MDFCSFRIQSPSVILYVITCTDATNSSSDSGSEDDSEEEDKTPLVKKSKEGTHALHHPRRLTSGSNHPFTVLHCCGKIVYLELNCGI